MNPTDNNPYSGFLSGYSGFTHLYLCLTEVLAPVKCWKQENKNTIWSEKHEKNTLQV